MIAVMMQRLMIQAEPELVERAKRRAAERGVSVAQVVREALEHELAGDEEEPLAPPLDCIGMFASGRGDLSRRASEDEFEPEPFR
jgi:plasmid stability protein